MAGSRYSIRGRVHPENPHVMAEPGVNIVALLVAALEEKEVNRTPQQSLRSSNSARARCSQRNNGKKQHRYDDPPSEETSFRWRTSKSKGGNLGVSTLLPGAVVADVLDFLPAPEAVALIRRSRSAKRRVECARHCLRRMERMVMGIAKAEEAFQARKEAGARADIGQKEDASYLSSPRTPVPLGDMEHLDLIYKLAHDLAHGTPSACVTKDGDAMDIESQLGSNSLWSESDILGVTGLGGRESRKRIEGGGDEKQDGETGERILVAARLTSLCGGLMSILASGLHQNLSKKSNPDYREVGILTDCLHPGRASHFTEFGDALACCGMLGTGRCPLVVVNGVCVLDLQSPIYACLPFAVASPICLRLASVEGVPGATAHGKCVPSTETCGYAVFRSDCGRYDATLVKHPQRNNSKGNTEVVCMVAPETACYKPCDSWFCSGRTTHLLVLFRTEPLVTEVPDIMQGSDGEWRCSDPTSGMRLYNGWREALGDFTNA